MAAIAYVTDEKMLEYHRVNGSHSIVFWRLSSKKFSDFKPGDLLFFLSKDNEIRKKEKGLIGYGVYKGDSAMALNNVWRKYGTQTGYNSKAELTDAIVKSCKTEEIPKKVSCLLLEKVVFFASPIYLSELGYSISNKLESFMYLQSDKGNLTLKILKAAEEIGLDSWSLMQNDHLNETLFEQQLLKYRLLTITDSIGSEMDISTTKAKDAFNKIENVDKMWITQDYQYFVDFGKQNVLYCLYFTNNRGEKDNYYKFLGMLLHLAKKVNDQIKEPIIIKVIALSSLNADQKQLIQNQQIEIIEEY